VTLVEHTHQGANAPSIIQYLLENKILRPTMYKRLKFYR